MTTPLSRVCWYCSISMCIVTNTVYPKKYAHGFCFAVLCCGYTLTDFPISIRLTSLALWQSNDCPSASKQPWWIWINTSSWFIMNDCITTTKQSTTKPCAYFLGYTVCYTRSHFHNRCLSTYWNPYRLSKRSIWIDIDFVAF